MASAINLLMKGKTWQDVYTILQSEGLVAHATWRAMKVELRYEHADKWQELWDYAVRELLDGLAGLAADVSFAFRESVRLLRIQASDSNVADSLRLDAAKNLGALALKGVDLLRSENVEQIPQMTAETGRISFHLNSTPETDA